MFYYQLINFFFAFILLFILFFLNLFYRKSIKTKDLTLVAQIIALRFFLKKISSKFLYPFLGGLGISHLKIGASRFLLPFIGISLNPLVAYFAAISDDFLGIMTTGSFFGFNTYYTFSTVVTTLLPRYLIKHFFSKKITFFSIFVSYSVAISWDLFTNPFVLTLYLTNDGDDVLKKYLSFFIIRLTKFPPDALLNSFFLWKTIIIVFPTIKKDNSYIIQW